MNNIEKQLPDNIGEDGIESLENHNDKLEIEPVSTDIKNEEHIEQSDNQGRIEEAPVLEHGDMINKDGEVVDFAQATNYHELIEMINEQGSITNGLGQEVPAETMINFIYKLTYQDLNNFTKEDWTRITLRHNLRATVANLIADYKKSDEFQSLIGLDLSQATSITEVLQLIGQRDKLVNANGSIVSAHEMANYITSGYLHMLPEPIRFKVIELNKQESRQAINDLHRQQVDRSRASKPTMGSRISKGLSKLKFWK